MSTNLLAAVSLLADLLTVSSRLTEQANELAAAIKRGGGTLTDAEWNRLIDADTAAMLRLMAAIERRRKSPSP